MTFPIRHLSVLGFLLLAVLPVAAQTPVASLRSGAWNDPALWSTGSVPTAASAVTIAAGHKVHVTPATAPIAALVVEAGAIVQRYSGPDGIEVLTVLSDVTNRGTIHPFNMDADIGYDRLGLRVGGNVVNEGLWDAEFTELTSQGAQTLTFGSAPANTVNRRWTDTTPASAIVAGSDLRVAAGGTIQLGGGTLELGARRLALQQTGGVTGVLGNASEQAAGRIVSSGGTVEALAAPGPADGISLWNVRIDGPVTFAGYHNLGESVTVVGALTVATGAVVQRFSGQDGVRDLVVEGDVINRGTIHPFNTNADVGYDRLALRVSGNITNEGTWDAESTTLTGANAQTITRRGDGLTRPLGRVWIDETPASPTVAGSDLAFSGRIELRSGTLNLGPHRLTLQQSGSAVSLLGGATREASGRIVSNLGTVEALPSASRHEGTSLHQVRIEGPVTLAGYHNLGFDVVLSGPAVVASGAVLQRYSGQDGIGTLVVEGDIVNRGTIRPFNMDADIGYDRLYVAVGGSLTNEGRWEAQETHFTGTRTHTIRADSALHGTFIVDPAAAGSTTGDLVAASPLRFTGRLRLGPGALRMGPHALTFDGNPVDGAPVVQTGRIAFEGGAGRLVFARKMPVSLWDVRIDGDVSLEGLIQIGHKVVFGNRLTIPTGTVLQRYSGGDGREVLTVLGDLVNRGTVHPYNMDADIGYDQLGIRLGAGLFNEGQYNPMRTEFFGPGRHDLVAHRAVGGELALESPATPLDRILLPRAVGAGVQDRDFLTMRAMSSGAALDSLTLDGHGMQPPVSFGNAVRRTWTLRPSPAGTRVALTSLTLRYTDETLGTAREDSLHVYHSTDGGATWTRISASNNLTRDAAGNAVTLTNAPAYGTYALSSRVDAVTAAPNLVVSLAGPERIRVGPPNTYLVHYENTGTARLGDFFLSLRTTGGIYIDHVLPSSQKSGAPQPIRPAQFSTTGDNTYAVFWVEGLEPGQSRTMTAVLKTTADIQGLAFNPRTNAMEATVKGQIVPAVIAGAAIGLGGAAATGFAGDVATGILANTLANPGQRTPQEQQAVVLDAIKGAIDDWTGGPEKGMSTFSDEVAGKLGSKLGNPIAAAADLANNAGQIADAVRTGQERMAAAEKVPGAFTPGGPFGNGPGRQPIRFPDPPPATPSPVRSWDPNEKNGPAGLGEQGFVTSLGRMAYQIKFENKKEASDAAYEIVIVDTLSADLDPTTVVNGPTSHPIFEFTRAGNVLTWRAVGIELPPNVNAPEGEGYVSFTVHARPNLPSGTSIPNRATITFDLNKPIVTNTHVNTLDLTAPVTALRPLAAETAGSRVVVRWNANDAGGAGPRETAVYASRDGGPFEPIGTSLGDSLAFAGEVGAEYRFYALTTDAVGNAEVDRPALVATRLIRSVAVEDEGGALRFGLAAPHPNPTRGAVSLRFTLGEGSEPVRLSVYDVLGRRVAVLAEGTLGVGRHAATWDAEGVASGVYFVRLEQGRQRQVQRVVLAR